MTAPTPTRILYLSDEYGRHNRGTKPSIFHGLNARPGLTLIWGHIHTAGPGRIDGPALLAQIKRLNVSWVWIAHSWATFVGCTLDDIHTAGARVLGFGFSDPYNWQPSKLDGYDAYATNHFATYDALSTAGALPVTTIITAGDSSFHKPSAPKAKDVVVFGVGLHPRFNPRSYRTDLMRHLMKRLPDLTFDVFGSKWAGVPSRGQVRGAHFRTAISGARVCLDLQQPHAPLAHRMFEAMLCGTAVITRERPEVVRLFGSWPDLRSYKDADDLVEQVRRALDDDGLGQRQRAYALKHHDIGSRLPGLQAWFQALQGAPQETPTVPKNTPCTA